MRALFSIVLLLSTFGAFGQNAYTQDLYSYSVESDVEYGAAVNYAGQNEVLHLDIYRPTNDNNCNRPCLILIHGGAWVQDDKADSGMQLLAQKFVQKGWVVASINYRLGTHKPSFYSSTYLFCNYQFKCWSITDSSEIFRANYRGQQDAKGAIRFMKARHLLDSTDISNFYVSGVSAGGFIAMSTAFLDTITEKPVQCGALPDAPNPYSFLTDCLPVGFSTARPDLGDFNGTIALNAYDASVQGVGTFIAGALNTNIFDNTTSWPSMYMFHQASDIVVDPGYWPLLSRTNACLSQLGNICPPFYSFPYAHGSFSVNSYLTSLPVTPNLQFDYLANSTGIPGDCTANGHGIDNANLRTQNLANHFAQRIFDNGNTPSSTCITAISENEMNAPRIFPNPSDGEITVELVPNFHTKLSIFTADGKLVQVLNTEKIQTIQLEEGVYFISVFAEDGRKWTEKVVVF